MTSRRQLLERAEGVLAPHLTGLDAFGVLHETLDGADFGRLNASLDVLMNGFLLVHRRTLCTQAHKNFSVVEEQVDGMIKKSLKRRKVKFVELEECVPYWLTQYAGTLGLCRGVMGPYEGMIEIWRGIQTPVS